MKEISLQQCMSVLTEYKDGTAQARMVELVANKMHSENFLREVERIAETSPDTERWKVMKRRLENAKAKQKEQPEEKGEN